MDGVIFTVATCHFGVSVDSFPGNSFKAYMRKLYLFQLIIVLMMVLGLKNSQANICIKSLRKLASFSQRNFEPPKELEEEVQESFNRWRPGLDWNWHIGPVEARELLDKTTLEENQENFVTVIYGEGKYARYRAGLDYLLRIPHERFQLSLNVLNRLSQAVLGKGLRRSFKIKVHGPYSQAEKQTLQANYWFSKNRSFSFTLGNKHYFMTSYLKGDALNNALNELFYWANSQKDELHPIEIAAKTYHALAGLAPFRSQNEILSRLILNRLLRHEGFPPSLMETYVNPLKVSPAEMVQNVWNGILNYDEIAKVKNEPSPPPPVSFPGDPNEPIPGEPGSNPNIPIPLPQPPNAEQSRGEVGATGNGHLYFASHDRTGNAPKVNLLRRFELDPDRIDDPRVRREPELLKVENFHILGGQEFLLYSDGFFYNNKGIPHLYHEGTLYPLAERTYLLYSYGGGYERKEKNPENPLLPTGTRRPHPKLQEVFNKHFELLDKIAAGEINPREIQVESYERIANANEEAVLHLYPFQSELLRNTLRAEETDPYEILNPASGINTVFDYLVSSENYDQIHPALVLAQYEKVDYDYWEFERFAREQEPMMIQTIRAAREKLHWAARTLIKEKYYDQMTLLTEEQRQEIRKFVHIQIFEDFLAKSKISYPTLDQALEATNDNFLYLIRADVAYARYGGIHSQNTYKRIFRRIFGGRRSAKWARDLAKFIEEHFTPKEPSPIPPPLNFPLPYSDVPTTGRDRDLKWHQRMVFLLSSYANLISEPRYSVRGASVEFERAMVDLYLHAMNVQKAGNSWTTNTSLLSNFGLESIPFVTSDYPSRIFLAKIPKRNVEINWISQFQHEFEYITMTSVAPWRIKKNYSVEESYQLAQKYAKDRDELNWVYSYMMDQDVARLIPQAVQRFLHNPYKTTILTDDIYEFVQHRNPELDERLYDHLDKVLEDYPSENFIKGLTLGQPANSFLSGIPLPPPMPPVDPSDPNDPFGPMPPDND